MTGRGWDVALMGKTAVVVFLAALIVPLREWWKSKHPKDPESKA